MTCPFLNFQMITSKYQWIFTKLCLCIDIVEIWFGIANGQISSIFDRVLCRWHVLFHITFSFPGDNFSKYQWIFTKLALCIDIVAFCFGKANCQIFINF